MIFFRLRTWQSGVKSLLLHPLRSLLTILGIFIGTASVIWLLAIGEGISAKAQQQIAELGADNVILKSTPPAGDVAKGGRQLRKYGLTRADYDRLTTIPTIERAVRIRETRRECKHLDHSVDARLVGCTPEYLDLNRLVVERGHFLADAELRESATVCVLAADVARALFRF
jgi:putative ABC transport system permease protein